MLNWMQNKTLHRSRAQKRLDHKDSKHVGYYAYNTRINVGIVNAIQMIMASEILWSQVYRVGHSERDARSRSAWSNPVGIPH